MAGSNPHNGNEVTPEGAQINDSHLIPALRASARLLVREFGFMSTTFAGTDMSSSSVHALIEIGLSDKSTDKGESATQISASDLCLELNLEKSSVSRLLKKLIEAGQIEEHATGKDGRLKSLSLTTKGKETLAMVDKYGDAQVQRALQNLGGGATAEQVLRGIETYANALRGVRLGRKQPVGNNVSIEEGYRSGLAGRVIDMHMEYYSVVAESGATFEAMVSAGLGDLIPRLDGTRAQVWTAVTGGEILGSVFIDAESKDTGTVGTAHFRYFIVHESLGGKGVGRQLVERAMKWVDERGFECHLWTFKGLDHARKLYDRAGFELVEEGNSTRLGRELCIQKFVRPSRAVISAVGINFGL